MFSISFTGFFSKSHRIVFFSKLVVGSYSSGKQWLNRILQECHFVSWIIRSPDHLLQQTQPFRAYVRMNCLQYTVLLWKSQPFFSKFLHLAKNIIYYVWCAFKYIKIISLIVQLYVYYKVLAAAWLPPLMYQNTTTH